MTATSNPAEGELFEDSFYNWLLKNGFNVWVRGSEMTSSFLGNPLTGELDMPTLKAAIQQLIARKVLEGRQIEYEYYAKILTDIATGTISPHFACSLVKERNDKGRLTARREGKSDE